MDFQTREVTQSAARQRQELMALTAEWEQMANASPASLRNLISEADLDTLIKKIAAAEVGSAQSDCGPSVLRNTARVRALESRFRALQQRYDEEVKKGTQNDLKDPRRVQQLAAQLKAEVLRECRP